MHLFFDPTLKAGYFNKMIVDTKSRRENKKILIIVIYKKVLLLYKSMLKKMES